MDDERFIWWDMDRLSLLYIKNNVLRLATRYFSIVGQ